MSIINDALKKTQEDLGETEKVLERELKEIQETEENKTETRIPTNIYEELHQKADTRKDVITPTPKKKSSLLRAAKRWFKPLGIIVFGSLCLWGGYSFLTHNPPSQNLSSQPNNTLSKTKSIFAQKAPKKRIYKSGDLVLSGTSLMDGKRVALINDNIYEIGGVINGKQITAISLNKVELLDNDRTVILKAH